MSGPCNSTEMEITKQGWSEVANFDYNLHSSAVEGLAAELKGEPWKGAHARAFCEVVCSASYQMYIVRLRAIRNRAVLVQHAQVPPCPSFLFMPFQQSEQLSVAHAQLGKPYISHFGW